MILVYVSLFKLTDCAPYGDKVIIHINGWPGVGKSTIGKLLAEKIGARFIHNHVLHDVALVCAGHGYEDRWP